MESEIVKIRWIRSFLWHFVVSVVVWALCNSLFLPLFSFVSPTTSSRPFLLSQTAFIVSLPLFFFPLSTLASPNRRRAASFPELTLGLARVLLSAAIATPSGFPTVSERQGAWEFLRRLVFIAGCGMSAGLALAYYCGGEWSWRDLGFRGVLVGLVYGVAYVYNGRFVLSFPIVQRSLFFGFKIGVPSAIKHAAKLSSLAALLSTVFMVLFPSGVAWKKSVGKFVAQQFSLYLGTFILFLCWELTHHLFKVLYTRRFIFAPQQGSAAAETNPSELLLAALEQGTSGSFFQYLAYLDLCSVCESNVDSWRRAAFFEETGGTFKRVVIVCLRPLEQFTSRLSEGLDDNQLGPDLLSRQMSSLVDVRIDLCVDRIFCDFQFCAWCARAVAALTAKSHKEDRYGVAQLTGCIAGVLTTLLSCLISVEVLLGKKTGPNSSQLSGAAVIKWATPTGIPLDTSRRHGAISLLGKKKGSVLHGKAYAMADVLRTSIYSIVLVFHDEMQASMKSGTLEKDWISDSKPLFGTREMLVYKLSLFIDFRAS